MDDGIAALRESSLAARVRDARLVVVLRRVAPRDLLLALVDELAQAGATAFEITFDAPDAAADLQACRARLTEAGQRDTLVGAGTILTPSQLSAACDAGADFVVSPVFDPAIVEGAIDAGLPVIPGAYTPTEIDRAWRAGATFVKLFPASSLGPSHIRELRGPLPQIELIPTGGIDASNAAAFLDAGAVAVGIGSAFVKATPDQRRAIVDVTRRPA